jgi:PST family polysaccharide transporter
MHWVTLQWTSITAQAAGLLSGIVLAWRLDAGYWALIGSAWVSAVVGVVLVWAVCPWRPTRVAEWTGAKSALKFGGYLTGFSFVNYFHRQLDNVLIGWKWGPEELGFYTRAYTLLTLPISLINGPISSAAVPALSRLQHDAPRWRGAYLDALSLATLLGSCIGAISIATADQIVLLLFGSGWDATSTIFRYLAFSIFIATPMNTTGWIFLSLGTTDRMFRWSYMATPVIVIAFALGLPYGAEGLALAYSLSIWLIFLPCLHFASKGTPVSFADCLSAIWPFIASGLGAAFIGLIANDQFGAFPAIVSIVFTAMVTASCFALILGLLCFVSPRTRDFLMSTMRRLQRQFRPA